MTKEQKEAQAIRIYVQKRESIATGLLIALAQAGKPINEATAGIAVKGAEHLLEALYPADTAE